jgi:predicted DCC family thiol-disulfide oxidoreductase YuxK
MTKLNNYLILFDAECPMCIAYTKAMVATGVLEDNGRAAYQHIAADACPIVDRQRAVNEIALINQTTGEVTYGIDSLFKIFGTILPILKPFFAFTPFVWLMRWAYAFLSYNRRVIIPAGAADNYALQPSFKLHYRIAYLLFTWVATAYILTAYVHLMTGLIPLGTPYREYLICGGQLFFQGAIISIINKDQLWAYLGNIMTVSFVGSLLLLPALLMSHWLTIAPMYYGVYFFMVAALMFLEHFRRTKLLKLGWALTISWACYRLLLLVLIFLAN